MFRQCAHRSKVVIAAGLVASSLVAHADAQTSRFDALANSAFVKGRPTADTAKALKDELLFQRATQTYLWAMPLLNTMGMRDGFAQAYGTGYNTMAIWAKRLDAKTLITTPNSDLIYGMVFVNLADTGPLVFEAPPKLQGILLDMWQRPIPGPTVNGTAYFGDVGLPGPDGGAGGKFLILPPGYSGDVPSGYYVYRSSTNNIFIFLRSFYQSLDNIAPASDLLRQCVLYPLGKQESAAKMKFFDASGSGHDMLPRSNFAAFQDLKYLVDTEGSNLADQDWMGMLAGLGIVKGKPFEPDARTRKIFADAAKTGYSTSRVIGLQADKDIRVYNDRQWVNPVNNVTARWPNASNDLSFTSSSSGYRDLDARVWFFTDYYSISPGMVSMTPGKGAFYMIAFNDASGQPLTGDHNYKVTLPPDIPAKLFWSVTLYDASNASGLDNGQPFPSLGKLNHPKENDDGSTTLYIGSKTPKGKEGNWLATPPNRGFFSILRLYAPTQAAIDGSWKPGDIERVK
ncbi:DUF1254 domain-containing protein [Paraburkholderia phytofirmans]|uniref:Uncharacterized protein n=1 Tax=Paraburkholderia phytofirmans (strain DSM 17436 / LMG 22146 / PsJN) TaxID=398527 RepID=B2T961_PARPJ|nr:DUF1254 domain-containing protein [Paraburkholderia phytofirmans]ACD20963.1 protein of unknown function DUF1214 [Paraburkholderia phytofirmans PsJN]